MDLPLSRTPERYEEFSARVREVLDAHRQPECDLSLERIEDLLDVGSVEATRKLIPRALRIKDGIFFSSKALADVVAGEIPASVLPTATIGDPTCGAGDLLLACANRLNKIGLSPEEWALSLYGADIHREFVDAAKARLELHASVVRPNTNTLPNFLKVRRADYFECVKEFGQLDVLVMNPPFGRSCSDPTRLWAQGNVQTAALFVEAAVKAAKNGQHIIAVLPDVLRSGTRYSKWREMITTHAQMESIRVWGRFDGTTDVDVFIVHLLKITSTQEGQNTWAEDNLLNTAARLKDFFEVRIGPVVLHRIKADDMEVPFLQVRGAPPNGETEAADLVRFGGKLVKPPFVVIRRTSNPADSKRVIATLVRGSKDVAVENHLIVVVPKDKTIRSCRRLLKHLSTAYADSWINSASRCRHLTKKVIEDLPLGDWK